MSEVQSTAQPDAPISFGGWVGWDDFDGVRLRLDGEFTALELEGLLAQMKAGGPLLQTTPSALADELRALVAVGGTDAGGVGAWRPIETAPKDGTRIDLWVVSVSRGDLPSSKRIPDAAWMDGAWKFYDPSYNYGDGGDREVEDKWEEGETKATCWMPPPAPPRLSPSTPM